MKRVKLIMRILRDNEVFNKDQELECRVMPVMSYNNENKNSYKAVYRIDYFIKKTKYIDIPFEREGDLCEVFEVLIDD